MRLKQAKAAQRQYVQGVVPLVQNAAMPVVLIDESSHDCRPHYLTDKTLRGTRKSGCPPWISSYSPRMTLRERFRRGAVLPGILAVTLLGSCSSGDPHPKEYVSRNSLSNKGKDEDLAGIAVQLCLRSSPKQEPYAAWIAWESSLSGIKWERMDPTSLNQLRYRFAYSVDRPREVRAIGVTLEQVKDEYQKQYIFVPPEYLPIRVEDDWTPWQVPTLTAYVSDAERAFLGSKKLELPPPEPVTDETPRIRYHLVHGSDFHWKDSKQYPSDATPC